MNCPKCNGEMWDNRGKKNNPKAPDFKCKDKACDGVIWPPRDGKKPSVGAPPPRQSSSSSDDRSNRIERQHSQEMAIRYLYLLASVGNLEKDDAKDTKKLRAMIDWFQRDVGHVPATKPSTAEVADDPIDEHPMNPANQEGPDEVPF